jgi:hypothetical protein
VTRPAPALALACLGWFTMACAQPGLYEWGPYEGDVLELYESPSPETEREFAADLETLILEARKAGRKTPPGVAAEYGFLQYKAGKSSVAVEYFDLERRNWPESAVLMTRLIERLQGARAPDTATDTTGKDEAGASGGVEQ